MKEKSKIKSIVKASELLNCIAIKNNIKLNEICKITGLKPSTAFGILETLEYTGQVTRTLDGLYTLGINSLKFGLYYLNNRTSNNKINILLNKLVERINETSYFLIKIEDKYYYLDYVVSSHPLKIVPEEGEFIDFPDNSAVGKIYENLNEKIFYATDFEEVYEGVNCFAIPYIEGDKITGVVAVTGPSSRFTSNKMKEAYSIYVEIIKELELDKHLLKKE